MAPTFIGITFIAFLITQLVPGGPIERLKYSGLGGNATQSTMNNGKS